MNEIAMTTIGLYSDSPIIGGAERSLLNLARARPSDVRVIVCSTHTNLLDAASEITGIRTKLVSARPSLIGGLLDHRRAFKEMGLDLLQVTLCNPFASRAAIVGGVLARIPTVAVEQLVLPGRRPRSVYIKRAVSSLQARTIAVGEASAEDLHQFFGLPRSSISVVHNGVPDPGLGRRPSRETPVIGTAARFEGQKRLDLLIEAIGRIPDVRLVLVGDGGDREDLQAQAASVGIVDRTEFVGWVEDAPARIAAFDVFALPSSDESFPLTIVEAMLAGTPVVATDVGSVSEAVIDGVTGLLVPSNDVDALVQALRQMIDDPATARRLASAARERAHLRFTDRAMAEGYQRVWSEILNGRGAQAA